MLIKSLKPLRVHLRDRTIDLRPGQPTELADNDAIRLLEKKPETVRRVSAANGHCVSCGSGYWIRIGHDAEWQCGRCQPSESRVETVFVPGGSPPSRKIQPTGIKQDWLSVWQELACLAHGITADDCRFDSAKAALDQCDDAYLRGDWPGFLQGADLVRQAVEGTMTDGTKE